jgi:hypothetical protein
LSPLIPHLIFCFTLFTHTVKLEVHLIFHSSWPHSVGQHHFFVMMLFNRDFTIQSAFRKLCIVYKSRNSDPCQPSGRRDILSGSSTVQSTIGPDDMDFCPDAKVLIASSVRTMWIPVRTFLYVEKLRTTPACIRLDVSTARSNDPQCSTSFRISFQNTDMGKSLQPSGRRGFPSRRRGFPSGRAHP